MLDAPPAGREELQAIVARSGRRRARFTAAGMAVTLVIGGAAGWAVRPDRPSGGTNIAAAFSPPTTVAPKSQFANGTGLPSLAGPGGPGTVTKKFVRTTTDGITIRAYQQSLEGIPQAKLACGMPFLPGLLNEISTADIATEVGGGFTAQTMSGPFVTVSSTVAGVMENAPLVVVTVKTAAPAVQVRVLFDDGKSDQMAPVDGWSVLAHLAPGTLRLPLAGSVQALDASGKVLATSPLSEPGGLPKGVPQPAVGAGSVSSSGGTVTSGGSAGTVTASGSAGPAGHLPTAVTTVPVPPPSGQGGSAPCMLEPPNGPVEPPVFPTTTVPHG